MKTTRRRRGDKVYEYLSLVESVRDGAKVGHRTLLRLGEVTALRESGQLERIVAALESHLRKERVDVGALAAEGAPAAGAVAAVAALWQRLGLDGHFAGVGCGRRGVRDGGQPAGGAVLEAAANRMGPLRRGDARVVVGSVAEPVLPGPRRGRRRQGRDRAAPVQPGCATCRIWI